MAVSRPSAPAHPAHVAPASSERPTLTHPPATRNSMRVSGLPIGALDHDRLVELGELGHHLLDDAGLLLDRALDGAVEDDPVLPAVDAVERRLKQRRRTLVGPRHGAIQYRP